MSDMRNQIRDFVQPRFPEAEIGDACDIFSTGVANSLFAMELVLFVERLLALQLPQDELTLDNFRSIDSMTALAGRLADATHEPARAGNG